MFRKNKQENKAKLERKLYLVIEKININIQIKLIQIKISGKRKSGADFRFIRM